MWLRSRFGEGVDQLDLAVGGYWALLELEALARAFLIESGKLTACE